MTYAEKLRDPRWQRKRLEKLEWSRWECDCCGTAKKTLHVHHRRYIKGREPWDYSIDELSTYCEDCHTERHWVEDRIKEVVFGSQLHTAFAFLCGLHQFDDSIDPATIEEARQYDFIGFMAGTVAHFIDGSNEEACLELIRKLGEKYHPTSEIRHQAEQLLAKHRDERCRPD